VHVELPGGQPLHRPLPRRRLLARLRSGRDLHVGLPGRRLLDDLPDRLVVHAELQRRRMYLHRRGLPVKRATSIARSLAGAVLISTSLFASTASAQSDKALAKEAYDRGTQASARGDSKRAAEEFARADALAPSPVALQAALDAAVDADDPVLGAELLERSKRAAPAGALAASVDTATKKLGGRAGHVKVACPSGAQCTSRIDGHAFDPAKGLWLRAGPHVLDVVVDGTNDTRTVEVRAGEDFELVPGRTAAASSPPVTPVGTGPGPGPAAPPGGGAPAPASDGGAPNKPLSPAVFIVGAGLTVVLAGAATILGLSAKGKHDDFTAANCGTVPTSPCQGLKSDGETSQRGANIAFAATGAAGAATLVIGLFFTDWGGSNKRSGAPVVVPVAGGMAAGYGASF
jgi:hypothetical protein